MSERFIVKGYMPCVSILTAEVPTPQEEYAAWELTHYINLMGSVSVPREKEYRDTPVIAIGAAAAVLGFKEEAFHEEGFRIVTRDGSMAIMGGVRGIIYGVYELLEMLGCRFFTPLCEQIPSVGDIPMPQVDVAQTPILEYRRHAYADIKRNDRFAAKLRLNADSLPEYL